MIWKKAKKAKCSVLVNTCDAFEDAWEPFFKLFDEYWQECNFPVYMNTEEKIFQYGSVSILNHSTKMPWSDRFINSLKQISTEYVFLILDDFFINQKVDHDRLMKCIDAMDSDPEIAVFSFAPSKWIDIDDGNYEGFELRPVEGDYRFNMQAALWRKKDLLKILHRGESPWETEHYGTFRARVLMSRKKFYAAKKDHPRIVNYEYGGAIHRGMWTKDTPAFLESHGICNIDYTKRGFDPRPTSDWEKFELDKPMAIPKKRSLKIRIVEYLYAIGLLKFRKKG